MIEISFVIICSIIPVSVSNYLISFITTTAAAATTATTTTYTGRQLLQPLLQPLLPQNYMFTLSRPTA